MKKLTSAGLPLFFLSSYSVLAHCPLCTAGVAAAAGGALWLGVERAVIALLVGAFAVSTGWWVGKLIKKQIIPYQQQLIIVGSFLLTLIPLLPLVSEIHPITLHWFGTYGSLFNRTYIFNISLLTAVAGGLLIFAAPPVSRYVSSLRNGTLLPFQGVAITFLLLLLFSITLQVLL